MIREMLFKIKKDVMVIILMAFAAFVFLFHSPLHPWIGSACGTDSSVFQTIALMMKKGYMPYRDSFDHKGPLIYIINYIGKSISNYRGVWVIEYMSLTATMCIFYLIAKIINKNCIQAIISVFAGESMLFQYFEGGNFTEEYAMLFIAVGICIFLDYMVKGKITRVRLIICGFCFGAVCMLRVNMVVVWIVYCPAVFITCIFKKDYTNLRRYILWFMVGFCSIIIPIIIWLWGNNALMDFWFDYIQFNILYTSVEGGRALPAAKNIAFYAFLNTPIYTFSLVSTIYLVHKNKYIYETYFIYLIVNLFLVSMSGMTFGHYGMMLIPATIFPVASIMENFNEKSAQSGTFLLAAFLLCNVIASDWETTLAEFISVYEDREKMHVPDETTDLVNVVVKNSSDEDRISVYGNYDIVYVLSGRMHATKYSYQFPIGNVSSDIKHEYWQELYEEVPKLIVIQGGHFDNDIIQFLEENKYEVLWAVNEQSLNEGASVFVK